MKLYFFTVQREPPPLSEFIVPQVKVRSLCLDALCLEGQGSDIQSLKVWDSLEEIHLPEESFGLLVSLDLDEIVKQCDRFKPICGFECP